MKKVFRLFSGLKTRFISCYLLLTVIPIALLYQITYSNAAETAQRKIIETQTERAYADRQYMQLLFRSIESKYDLFADNTTLTRVLDNTSCTERSVMYDYVSELSDLLSRVCRDTTVDDVTIYTQNEIAARILPNFYPIDTMDLMHFPEDYAEHRNRTLYRHFWALGQEKDTLVLKYYAGLFNSDLNIVNGVLSISCTDSLKNLLGFSYGENEAIALYLNGRLVYSDGMADSEMPVSGEPVEIQLDDATDRISCVVRLPEQGFALKRIYSAPRTVQFPGVFWLALSFFIAMSLLVMFIIFRPLNNITALARHMKSMQALPMQPYQGNSHTREIYTIIHEYNALGQRINTLSQTVNQKELLLRNAQIERLQSQLNPHFFYGTLESIRMIAEVENQPEIAEIAYDFSSLMRYSLSRDFFAPLEQEIEIVKQYIAIQQKRIGNRFEVTWSSDVETSSWRCPKFVLFSMVENAFTHDVNHSRRKVHIEVALQESGEELRMQVANDGPGIPQDRLEEIRHMIKHPEDRQNFTSANNGRSIFNINDRLQFYYGEDYRFHIESVPEKQTVCSVTIKRNAKFLGKENEDAEYSAD
ncbi:MAG: histidine kinase [Clostridia bacterium]|nr:histidine kinase [Clostridia bacterium]